MTGARTQYGYDPISRLSALSHDLDGAGAANDASFGLACNPASQITTRSLTNNAYEYVTTDVDGKTVVVNVTVPGEHILSPGIVSQYILPSETSTSIVVVGEGNSILSVPTTWIAKGVFQRKIEGDMRSAISGASR